MKKLCIYVEGKTEQIFVEKLVTEIANKNEISLSVYMMSGGGKNSGIAKSFSIIRDDKINEKTKYYIQIINCQSDNRVQSEIRSNCISMQNAGFEKILGIRDLYPLELNKLNLVKQLAVIQNKDLHIIAKSIISAFEIETWFLSEFSFLQKINKKLTYESIKKIGFDLKNDRLDKDLKYFCSSNVLNIIYNSVGRTYDKKEKKIKDVVEKLDYEMLYLKLRNKLEALDEFLSELEDFFNKK